jgi:hypothetical protein
MKKPRNQTKKCKLTTQKPKPTTNAKINSFKEDCQALS